ncbi:hypothetical protein LQW54_009365, partial [Pestalotiopsis sp. IQ-011]
KKKRVKTSTRPAGFSVPFNESGVRLMPWRLWRREFRTSWTKCQMLQFFKLIEKQ